MPPKSSRGRQTVSGSVEGARQADKALSAEAQRVLDTSIREAEPYIRAIVPAHMNPAQYVAITLGMLHKDDRLAAAVYTNLPGFLAALADCARLGLVPGDGYAFLTFWDKDKQRYEIVGMSEYTGELDLIFRTGAVRTVVAEVVFPHDEYTPGAHPHEPPQWKRAGGRFASDTDRGGDGEPHSAEGGFAYAVFNDGSTSRVVLMGRDEIMLHRAVARSKEGWDSAFWKSYWLKTLVHELYKWLQKSAEYRQHQIASAAGLASTPLGTLPLASAVELASSRPVPAPPNRAITNGDPPQMPPGEREPVGAEHAKADRPAPQRAAGGAAQPRSAAEAWDQAAPLGGEE